MDGLFDPGLGSMCKGMSIQWFRRPVAVVSILALLAQIGCAGGAKSLSEAELVNPKPARSYHVFLRDGTERSFISLHREGDWLLGTERITVAQTQGEGETSRTNVTNRYEPVKLAMADVARVEADGTKGFDGSLILAAGTILIGVAAFVLLTQDSEPPPSGGGGGKGL